MPPRSVYSMHSPRLLARCWHPDDAPAFRALLDRNDRHLRPFIPWMRDEPMPLAATRERLRGHRARFEAGEDFRYALCETDGTLVGELILSTRSGAGTREVGYLVDHARTGRGYATEATAMALRVGFGCCGVQRVVLVCSPENTASVRVARKLGFVFERVHARHYEDSEGEFRDSMVWSMDAAAFAASDASRLPVQAFDADGAAVPLATP